MLAVYINNDNNWVTIMKKLINFSIGLILLLFCVCPVMAEEATGHVKVIAKNGTDVKNTNQEIENTESDDGISGLIPSLSGGVNALKKNWGPIYDYLKSISWGSVGLAVGVGIIVIALSYTKLSAGTLTNKIKWITSGQNGMIIPGLGLLALIIYLSVIKFMATWNS
jgi:hypothetical protein